jgi:hypothetical protein
MLGQRCKTTPLGRILVASLCASILASASSATAITDNLASAGRSVDDRAAIADQSLPRPLGAKDAGLYRRIFRVQGDGDSAPRSA